MNSQSSGILIGLVIGIVASFLLFYFGGFATPPTPQLLRDIVDAQPMDIAEVTEHRNNQFSTLESIESLQSLPGDFVRSEALHALCSRSNSDELLRLATDAARLQDPYWREKALDIIFQRLTELAPVAALELSRSSVFASDLSTQATVLQTWARNDLVAALTAVDRLDDSSKSLAAQMIYSGIGGAYTPDALTVEQFLDIQPSGSNRERFVRELFSVSPDLALEHVLALESKTHQHEQVQVIARLLSLEDVARAETFAEQIDNDALRNRYLSVVYDRLRRTNPAEAALKRFALRDGGKVTKSETTAFKQIVESDLDSALELFEQLDDDSNREALGKIIASEFAKNDSRRALRWAQNAPGKVRRTLVSAVIVQMADADPGRALQEAGQLKNDSERGAVLRLVVSKLVEQSPQFAAEQIGSIENESARNMAAQVVANKWLNEDPFAAVDWVLNADPVVQAAFFGETRFISDVDLYEAQALATSIPREYRSAWARNVAERLVEEQSPDDAILFVSQFSGEPDYEMQLAHVVSRIARTDSGHAAQWVDRIPRGYARDGAISSIVMAELRNDPADTIAYLPMIDDPDLRRNSAGSVAKSWLRSDHEAALQWIDTMPRGAERDSVLSNAVVSMYPQSDMQLELIKSIDDPDQRQQAMFMRGMMMSRDDPDELLRQLEQIEMPDIFKQEIKSQILRQSVDGR